jgi:quercetin dioxygenase-like cupin family protein
MYMLEPSLSITEAATAGSAAGALQFVHFPDQGETLHIQGVSVRILVDGRTTSEKWALVEYSVPAFLQGPAPHWHKVTTESFFVLGGTLTFLINDETIVAPAGTFVMVPVGVVHTFYNREAVPATCLIFISPAGFEDYFREVAALWAAGAQGPPVDPTLLPALPARYDTFAPESV